MQSEADMKGDADIGVDRSGSAEAVDGGREKFQFYSGLKNRRLHSVGMKNHPENPEDPSFDRRPSLACQTSFPSLLIKIRAVRFYLGK